MEAILSITSGAKHYEYLDVEWHIDYGWSGGGGKDGEGSAIYQVKFEFGREIHYEYHLGEIGKEFRLPSGKRIDFLDIPNSSIYELKPFNPRAMKAGQKQLNMYLKELQTIPGFKGVNWKTILDTY